MEADLDYEVVGGSIRSFEDGHAFLRGSRVGADVLVCIGGRSKADPARVAVLVELDMECLGDHTGERMGDEGSNCLELARYRNGDDAPSNLIELVRQPETHATAIDAAKAVFANAGFDVALCSDQTGRIVDRLVRPK